MDRWGFSEDCQICGEPQSYGNFAVCPVCGKAMCHLCIHNHECHDVFDIDGNEQGEQDCDI